MQQSLVNEETNMITDVSVPVHSYLYNEFDETLCKLQFTQKQ